MEIVGEINFGNYNLGNINGRRWMDDSIGSCLITCVPCNKLKKYKSYPKSKLYPADKRY